MSRVLSITKEEGALDSYLKGRSKSGGGMARQVPYLMGQSAWGKGATFWLFLKLCVLNVSS